MEFSQTAERPHPGLIGLGSRRLLLQMLPDGFSGKIFQRDPLLGSARFRPAEQMIGNLDSGFHLCPSSLKY